MDSPGHRLGRARIIATIGLMALALFSLTQCRLVEDRLTGIRAETFHNNSATRCIVLCNADANETLFDEQRIHFQRVKACNNDGACLAAEAQRHVTAMKQIEESRRACIEGCHHQGGGSGGD